MVSIMTAVEARNLTNMSNSFDGELKRVLKKVKKESLKGNSWIEWNNLLPETIDFLKSQGYEVLDCLDYFKIEW